MGKRGRMQTEQGEGSYLEIEQARVRQRVGDADDIPAGRDPLIHPIPAANAQPVIRSDQRRQGIPSSSGPPLALPPRSLQDNELSSSRVRRLNQVTTPPRANRDTTQVEGDLDQRRIMASASIPMDSNTTLLPPALDHDSRAPSIANMTPARDIVLLELFPDNGHVTGGEKIAIYGRDFPREPPLYVRFGNEVQGTVRDKSLTLRSLVQIDD